MKPILTSNEGNETVDERLAVVVPQSEPQLQPETLVLAEDPTKRASDAGSSDVRAASANDRDTGYFSFDQVSVGTVDGDAEDDSRSQELSFDKTTDYVPAAHTPANGTTRISRSNKKTSSAPLPMTIGHYQIKRLLGHGGMGVVYLAHQADLRRDVALKMVLAGKHASAATLERFKAEARAVAQLQHPHIVQVFEVGEHEGLPFFSLEFVGGGSLENHVDRKPLPPREAAAITEKVCRAMQYAHERGILHRDLKPANILLTTTGDPKITDFGLAKQLEDDEIENTKTGTVMGTPSYMSPEQATGRVNAISPASDQYSLGAMLYDLLTGRPPFLGTKAFETISQVVHKEPIPPCTLLESLPRDIDTICLKALNKQPEKRYASCVEMADDLRRFLQGEPILARPISRVERTWRWCQRNPLIAIPTALASLLLLATATVASYSYFRISGQARTIIKERDDARQQRLIAVQNEERANIEGERAKQEKAEADRQRILADEAKLQAEKNQQLAEKQAVLALQNIQLVVTEVDDRLAKEPGMANIRIGMLEVLERKWDELDVALAGGIQGQAVPTLMAVRSKIADAWFSLDRLKEADAHYQTLYEQAQQRLIVKNRNDASRFNLSILCNRWAPIRQRLKGDPDEAEKLCTESRALLRDILRDPRPEPGSPQHYQITDQLQQSLMRSAAADIKGGNLQRAQGYYDEVGTLCQGILDQIAQGAEWFKTLPDARQAVVKSLFEQNRDLSQSGRANVLCRLGKVDQAIPLFEQSIERRRQGLKTAPDDRNLRDQLGLQLRNYGQYMMRSGKIADAVRLLGESHDLVEKNYLADPKSASSKRSLGHGLYYWGVARDLAGQPNDALALFERSRVLRQEMFDTSPDQANRVNLMLSLARLGNREPCLQQIEELKKSTARDPDLWLDIARAYSQLSQRGDSNEQKGRDQSSSIDCIKQAIESGLRDPYSYTTEPDLQPLQSLPDFRAIIAQI